MSNPVYGLSIVALVTMLAILVYAAITILAMLIYAEVRVRRARRIMAQPIKLPSAAEEE